MDPRVPGVACTELRGRPGILPGQMRALRGFSPLPGPTLRCPTPDGRQVQLAARAPVQRHLEGAAFTCVRWTLVKAACT
jgi:hypothetical protein